MCRGAARRAVNRKREEGRGEPKKKREDAFK
jgi:hypothetical protein